jgi:hypothetical protein
MTASNSVAQARLLQTSFAAPTQRDNGPTLVVTFPVQQQLIGLVGFRHRDEGTVEMIYGIAPSWREQQAEYTAGGQLRLGSVRALSAARLGRQRHCAVPGSPGGFESD